MSDDCDPCNSGPPTIESLSFNGETFIPDESGNVELACPDTPDAPLPDPAVEDCLRATKRWCPIVDADGNIVVDADGNPVLPYTVGTHPDTGKCCVTPNVAVLLEYATDEDTAAICEWIAANCADRLATALLSDSTFAAAITSLVFGSPAFCERVSSVTPFNGETSLPVCTSGGNAACVEFFRDTSLASDGCPEGFVTHACVGGAVICFASGSGGVEPEPETVPLSSGTSGAWTVGFDCAASYPNTISAADLANIQSSTGMCADSSGGAGWQGGFALDFAHPGGNLEICFDISDGGAPGVTFDYTTFELLNGLTPVLPSSVSGGLTHDTYVSGNCVPARTVQRFNIGGGVTTLCLTFNGLAAGNYTINTGSWGDGTFAGSGFPEQCLSNLTLVVS